MWWKIIFILVGNAAFHVIADFFGEDVPMWGAVLFGLVFGLIVETFGGET